MVVRRGDGVGLEVTRDLVRGVRLDHDRPGQVVDVCEVPIDRFDDDDHVREAFVVARDRLRASAERTHIAWFPGGATLQRIDVTGRGGPELNAIRHDLDEAHGISSTMLIEGDAHRWMLALRWGHRTGWRLQGLAELAGLAEVEVEPAPTSLGRVLPPAVDVARHAASAAESWVAVYDRGAPYAAASLRVSTGDYPALETGAAPRNARFEELGTMQAQSALFATVTDVVSTALDLGGSSPPGPALRLVERTYPDFPPHDLRAAHRVCVALGAALGAAGLAGNVRAVDVVSVPKHAAPTIRHPWSVERVVDAPDTPERTPLSWWRRAAQAVRSGVRRSLR